MADHVIHISEAEALSNFADGRAGAEKAGSPRSTQAVRLASYWKIPRDGSVFRFALLTASGSPIYMRLWNPL